MRILTLSHSYPGGRTPWTTPFVHLICKSLADLQELDVHISIPELQAPLSSGAIVHTFNLPVSNPIPHKRLGQGISKASSLDQLRYLLSALRDAVRVIRSESIDIVHAHWTLPSGLVALLAHRLTGCPYVVTTHGKGVLNYPEYDYGVPSSRVLSFAVRQVLSNAACVLTTSETTEDAARSLAPSMRSQLVPIGVELSSSVTDAQDRNGIIFVGDLIERKGIKQLLHAMASEEALRGEELRVVGSGPLREELEQFALENKLNVHFLGSLEPNEVLEQMTSSRALVFPSLVEAFGIVVLEALSQGTPVVGASVGVLPTLVQDEVFKDCIYSFVAGDVRGMGDALKSALVGKPQASVGQVRARLLEQYSWANIAGKHLKIYQEVISQHGKR